MKKLIPWLSFAFLAIAPVQHCNAQYGHATLKVTAPNSKVQNFTFKQFPAADYGFDERKSEAGSYTDLSIEASGLNNDQNSMVTVQLRIDPSGVGKFYLNTKDDNTPKASITISLASNGVTNAMLMNVDETSSGTITVTHYPQKIGDSIVGTFEATLSDQSDNKSGNYKVSGSFDIKKTSEGD